MVNITYYTNHFIRHNTEPGGRGSYVDVDLFNPLNTELNPICQ